MNYEAELNEVLLESFDKNSLQRVVRFTFDSSLEQIAGSGDLYSVVFDLVRWSIQNNMHLDLIDGAIRENPSNEALKEIKKLSNKRTWNVPSAQIPVDETSLHVIAYRLQRVEEMVQKLHNITVGPDGDNGIRSAVDNLSREYNGVQTAIKDLSKEYKKGNENRVSFSKPILSGLIIASMLINVLIQALEYFSP